MGFDEIDIIICTLETKYRWHLQYPSKWSSRLIIWFFCNCKNWVEAQCLLPKLSRLTCSRGLGRWVSFSKLLPSLTFTVVLMSRNKFFNFASFWEAKSLKAPIKKATSWWGSELQRKIGSSKMFEELDTEIGSCFHIQFHAFVSLNISFSTQIDSNSSVSELWRTFVHSCT